VSVIKNKTSLEWTQVNDHCTRRLAELHAENEGDLGRDDTARIRGMIAMAKEVMDLGVDEPTIQIVQNDYID